MKFEIGYKTIESVAGPLVVVGKVGTAAYGEIVKIKLPNGETRLGQVLDTTEKYAVVQVFGTTIGIDTDKTTVSFLGETFNVGVSDDMLGRVFDGQGRPRDTAGEIAYKEKKDVNGEPINPTARTMPSDFIETGVSGIDGLMTLVRGQKLPIFSGSGLPHNQLAAQIARQARVKTTQENFAVVFAGIGVTYDDAMYFVNEFRKTGALSRSVAFINLADDPSIERILTPRLALTTAEYLAYEHGMHVLVMLDDMTNYCFHKDTEIILNDGTIERIGDYVERFSSLNNSETLSITAGQNAVMLIKNRMSLKAINTTTLSFDNLNTKAAKITAVQKIRAPSELMSIKTRSGGELKVTVDHKILVDTEGGPALIPAGNLKKGMEIYSAARLDITESSYNILDILYEDSKNFFVHMKNKEIERELAKRYGSIRNSCNALSINYDRVTEAFGKRSYKLAELKAFSEEFGIPLETISNNIDYITAGKNGRIHLSKTVLDASHLKILGMIASDGSVYEDSASGTYYISFTNTKRELVDEFVDSITKLFPGVNPQMHTNQNGVYMVRINSHILSSLFGRLILKDKPNELNPVFKMSKDAIAAFLSGYLDGDGSIPHNKDIISYTTASSVRAKRLQQLLKRLGVLSTIYKRFSMSSFRQSEVYDVTIRGRNDLSKMAEVLTLSHPEKKSELESIRKKLEHASPERSSYFNLAPLVCGGLLRALRTRYGLRARDIGLSSTISQFEQHKRRLSVDILRKLLEKIEPYAKDDADYHKLRDLVNGGYVLDRIVEVSIIKNENQEYVYDFTVKDTHRIIAENGLVTSNCEALRELSSAREEVPGRRGYPGYMYTDLASIYERAGIVKGKKGSITQLNVVSMPSDDVTHPIPDLTGYITEGQIFLARDLHNRGVYPPINPLGSLSRLMNNGIGAGKTREDHRGVADQLYGAYAKAQDARNLSSIVGAEALSESDRLYLKFGEGFENRFIRQGLYENRSIEETLGIGWDLLATLPEEELTRIKSEYIAKYYKKEKKE